MCIYKLFEDLRNQELSISMGTKFQCKFEETTSVSVSKSEKSSPHSNILFLCGSF